MSDQIAVIVGGTSGIGLATALRLSAAGAAVHVVGRDPERLDDVIKKYPELIGHRADGADQDQMADLFDQIGHLDQLVVALSGSDGAGPLATLDLTRLRRSFDAKFWGHITTVKAALPRLAEDGSITLIGAITARTGMPGTAGLAAINGAVEAMVQPLAIELAPIRVNAVSPGLVDTPWWSGLPESDRAAYFAGAASALPVRRVATADDIAEVVVLAATNRNLTGTVLEADGGARLVSLG